MTAKEQIQLIGIDKFNVLDRIHQLLKGKFLITGSISLLAYGICKRTIGDIDILVDDLDAFKTLLEKQNFMTEEGGHYDKGNNFIPERVGFSIKGVKCCAFRRKPRQRFKSFSFLASRTFNVAHPKGAIEAKKGYVKVLYSEDRLTAAQIARLNKHSADIEAYYQQFMITKQEELLPFL
ncbi:MAG: hypothetical protein ACPG5P_01135 [Saprospiraceae bacterium]